MSTTLERECLHCGMLHVLRLVPGERPQEQYCSKCDSPLFAQTDNSTLTVDIAHQRETVTEALAKMSRTLDRAWQGYASHVRLIVGGGVIREAVLGEVHFLRQQERIKDYAQEGHNGGVILIRLR